MWQFNRLAIVCVLMVVAHICSPGVAQGSSETWHWLGAECISDSYHACLASHTHEDNQSSASPLLVDPATLETDVELETITKLVWTNTGSTYVCKPTGSVAFTAEVTLTRTLNLSVGSGTETSVNVAATIAAKNKTGAEIGFNKSWSEGQNTALEESVTMGAGVSDTWPNSPTLVAPGASVNAEVIVTGNQGSSTFAVDRIHRCEANTIAGSVTVYCIGPLGGEFYTRNCNALPANVSYTYDGDGDLLGSGSASGENPTSVALGVSGLAP